MSGREGGGGGGSYRPNYIGNDRGINRPNYRDDRPNYRPDNRPNYRGDDRDNYRPDNRPNYRGDDRGNYRPDNRPNYRGDDRDNYRPDNRPNYRGDDRDNYRPDNRPNYRGDRPNYRGDDRPNYRGDDRGSYRQDIRPASAIQIPKKFAYATIHFGSNPVYLELEIYFFRMLREYTKHDIIYLYSVNDTPPEFVDEIRPLVTQVIPYDDRKITFDVSFKSGYANFNTLRTCNFIFAYTLTNYDTVCIIESDMVIMKPLDRIFELNTPAVLTYYIGDRRLKFNDPVRNEPKTVLEECKNMGRLNGGVMLINPSMHLFHTYVSKIQDVVQHECKYPNETLFEYVNNSYYNLPVQYNLSHYAAKSHKLAKYGLNLSDIYVYHFNETKYKHLDIIKNPLDETGNNWLDIIQTNEKYEIKKFPIMHYKNIVYDKYLPETMMSMKRVGPKTPPTPRIVTPPKIVTPPRIVTPPKLKESPIEILQNELPEKTIEEILEKVATPVKKSKCPKGTQRNKKTGKCEPFVKKSKCPEGTVRSKITGECEPIGKKSKCPNGTRRNKKTGKCESTSTSSPKNE